MSEERVLTGITTYGSAPYVDLSLTSWARWGHCVLVLDDGSKSEKLQDVCDKHDAMLLGCHSIHNNKSNFADMMNTVTLIRMAYWMNYDFALKVSRRWICKEDPIPSLLKLAEESDGSTFSNYSTSFNFGFRTEFFAFRVKDWMPKLKEIEKFIEDRSLFAEGDWHKWAKQVQPKSEVYIKYTREHSYDDSKSGYVHWDWMGTDRKNCPNYIIWHDQHNANEYVKYSRELGLSYDLKDFSQVNG